MTGSTPTEVDENQVETDPEARPKRKAKKGPRRPVPTTYMQNRELSWLAFNQRVLDQSVDPSVPLLERLKFLAIWRSNLEEFFMVRVGSLLDLALAKTDVYDSKTGMTPNEQLDAVYARVRDLTPQASKDFHAVRARLANAGIRQLYPDELSAEQAEQVKTYLDANVLPLISPQIINATHPFPHLENGALYIAVRLDDEAELEKTKKASKAERKAARAKAAENVIMGIIPMPKNTQRIIPIKSSDGAFTFILLEHALELVVEGLFGMYPVKHANVIQVTRNADLDAYEEADENDEDFRTHMKRIIKKRARLAPVRLESEYPLSDMTQRVLAKRLKLKRNQIYSIGMPLDMGYAFALPSLVPADVREDLVDEPASPQWPASVVRNRSIINQVQQKDILLSYPYETMDAFVHLLQEASVDPDVISIKITLYRLASQSRLADALITAAENGKDVTALFELRARFDENNNIEWSHRFEQAGCTIIYGFHDFKVHSKICSITRRTPEGLQFITQLGTGNYNEKTAKLYTDFSLITADPVFGRDAALFFRSMQLESVSKDYQKLSVAPIMIKQRLCDLLDEQIARARAGRPACAYLKTNSVTDRDIIEKIAEASRAGVEVTMLVRGISCLVPGIPGETENVRVVSVVGRLLEHSRIYVFGEGEERKVFLSSADLMTRNLDKRVEIMWPVEDPQARKSVVEYFQTMLSDTAKLRELLPDGTYTRLGHFLGTTEDGMPKRPFDAQDRLIRDAYVAAEHTLPSAAYDFAQRQKLSTQIEAMAEEAMDDMVTRDELAAAAPVMHEDARAADEDAGATAAPDHPGIPACSAKAGSGAAAEAAAASDPTDAPIHSAASVQEAPAQPEDHAHAHPVDPDRGLSEPVPGEPVAATHVEIVPMPTGSGVHERKRGGILGFFSRLFRK